MSFKKSISLIIGLIDKQVREFNIPWISKMPQKRDPYRVLVSCLLSLRTKDKVTAQASKRLFGAVDSAERMAELPPSYIEKLIYPVGFYHRKSRNIREISRKIIRDYQGKVPCNLAELLKFKGVGRKTANLVLGLGYGIPAICVDTHVHRISNRLGWVNTKKAADTEEGLKEIIPRRYWIKLNTILVAFGQNICKPCFPLCASCRVNKWCSKRGVGRHH